MSSKINAALAQTPHGSAAQEVRQILRLEALAVLISASAAYFVLGGEVWVFALAFFVPDLAMLAYAVGSKLGAWAYNIAHSYVVAALIGAVGVLTGADFLWHIALIQAAHAGFDRGLGYGLKYTSGFAHTHLGSIGKR